MTRKLLFIVARGPYRASSLKRVYQLLPYLQELGYSSRVISLSSPSLTGLRYRARIQPYTIGRLYRIMVLTGLYRSLSRQAEKRSKLAFDQALSEVDTVILQKVVLPPTWQSALDRISTKRIFDFDDALWLQDDHFHQNVQAADHVVASNQYLADYARSYQSSVSIIPTGVDIRNFPDVKPKPLKSEFVIGWLGSPSGAKYLEILVEPLARLGKTHAVLFQAVGITRREIATIPNVRIEAYGKIPYRPVDYVAGFDVGVMPIPRTEWGQGKSGSKILDYMAAGKPVVCSKVGKNLELVDHGRTGFLVSSNDDWFDALFRLIQDSNLCVKVGEQGKAFVVANYSMQKVANLWNDLLTRI